MKSETPEVHERAVELRPVFNYCAVAIQTWLLNCSLTAN